MKNDSAQLNKDLNFPLIAIGCSAGGLDALEAFFNHLTVETGAAFVVVIHLKENYNSKLAEILPYHTKMPVTFIEDDMQVQPNHVYLAPAGKNLSFAAESFKLLDQSESDTVKQPIDFFFRALASDQKRKIVAIILSGAGTDGIRGVREIHAEGGLIIAQEPETAIFSNMPRQAIATGLVDYILPPEKMSEPIFKYLRYNLKELTLLKDNAAETLQKIFIQLRKHTGHDFSQYKQNTICRRIEKRMSIHQIESITTYQRYLQQHSQEVFTLFKEFLIGVTSFFRDPEAFEILKQEVLIKILKNKPKDYCIRVWVPGCSSGEEVYSVAIILLEGMAQLKKHFHIQIFGTDINETAIEAARAGIYPITIRSDINAERLKRFFKKEDKFYRVSKELRKLIIFAPQNLIKDPPFTKLDLICCRNLLIYLNTDAQKKLIPLFHYSLRSNGFLFLGSAENLGENVNLFNPINKKWKIFARKDVASNFQVAMDFSTTQHYNDDNIINTKDIDKDKKVQFNDITQHVLRKI